MTARRELEIKLKLPPATVGRVKKIALIQALKTSPKRATEVSASGMARAEGSLWVGQHRKRTIHQVDPQTGAILRTIESNRFVTGVTWVEGELWHGTWEAEESELRRIDPRTGEVLEQLDMPPGVAVSGLESNGSDTFFCGGGSSGKVRAVQRSRQS
jgi:hypothetical protein